MMNPQSQIFGIQSTAGAIPIRNEKGKYMECPIVNTFLIWILLETTSIQKIIPKQLKCNNKLILYLLR